MTSSLHRYILDEESPPERRVDADFFNRVARGYADYLQNSGSDDAEPGVFEEPSAVADHPILSVELRDPSALREANEIKERLAIELANILFIRSAPTTRAPTLRLEVEALRCA